MSCNILRGHLEGLCNAIIHIANGDILVNEDSRIRMCNIQLDTQDHHPPQFSPHIFLSHTSGRHYCVFCVQQRGIMSMQQMCGWLCVFWGWFCGLELQRSLITFIYAQNCPPTLWLHHHFVQTFVTNYMTNSVNALPLFCKLN